MTTAYIRTHLVQITDTTDRTAILKIRSSYSRNLGRYGLSNVDVDVAPSPATLDIGVTASELVNNSQRPDRLILALNCAPPDKREGTTDNARNDFYFADLGDNIFAGGTLNGFELSYLRDKIQRLYRLTTTNALKSQFRSLEILPQHIVRFSLDVERKLLLKQGDLVEVSNIAQVVPDVPDCTHVIEVDNFKNVKLYTSKVDRDRLAHAEMAQVGFGLYSVEFDRNQMNATTGFVSLVRPTLFAAPLGTNIIALSSSSRITGGDAVPMIATIRERPAETVPNYPVPKVGHPVFFTFAS